MKKKREFPMPAPRERAKKNPALESAAQLWRELFTGPVHLDSAISKRPRAQKAFLAAVVPRLLLRPASLCEAVGVGIPAGEPWTLSSEERAGWKAVSWVAERLLPGASAVDLSGVSGEGDFPPAMIQDWKNNWGEKTARELVELLGSEPPLSLRCSRSVIPSRILTTLATQTHLAGQGEVSSLAPQGLRFPGYVPVLSTPVGEEGVFEIQDEGSQLMALFALWPERFGGILQKKPGPVKEWPSHAPPSIPDEDWAPTVVDACAGAGGKTLAMADALAGKGRVYSYDTSEKKLQALRRRARKAGYNNIQSVCLKEGDEESSIGRFRRRANIVLVDAPCSGWGVLRRNPDIKWRQEPGVLERMPGIQNRLLSLYSSLVAPGGRLVFGVCTFRREETVDVVQSFLSANPDFEPAEGGYLGPGPCDGFFMQAFNRRQKGSQS